MTVEEANKKFPIGSYATCVLPEEKPTGLGLSIWDLVAVANTGVPQSMGFPVKILTRFSTARPFVFIATECESEVGRFIVDVDWLSEWELYT